MALTGRMAAKLAARPEQTKAKSGGGVEGERKGAAPVPQASSPASSGGVSPRMCLAPTGRTYTSPGQSVAPPWVGGPKETQPCRGDPRAVRRGRNGSPLQGSAASLPPNPGRCPGLECHRPVGAKHIPRRPGRLLGRGRPATRSRGRRRYRGGARACAGLSLARRLANFDPCRFTNFTATPASKTPNSSCAPATGRAPRVPAAARSSSRKSCRCSRRPWPAVAVAAKARSAPPSRVRAACAARARRTRTDGGKAQRGQAQSSREGPMAKRQGGGSGGDMTRTMAFAQ